MITIKLESSSTGGEKLLFDILEGLPTTQPYSLSLSRDAAGSITGTASFELDPPAAAPAAAAPVESVEAPAAAPAAA